jgi:ferrous iron transport protein B
MSTKTSGATVTVALLGNPNTGKSTLFNALAGVNQRVGNYPGVTVEKRVGRTEHGGRRFNLIDLPGTYSLTPRSPDEMVAVDVLLGRRSDVESPDVVVCIVNASNLPRNLYLVSQALELEKPVVVVLNMVDVAREKGIEVDVARLQRRLGVPVVETQADRRIGIDDLKQSLLNLLGSDAPEPVDPFPRAFRHEVDELTRELEGRVGKSVPRYVALRLLLDTGGYLDSFGIDCNKEELADLLHAARRRLTAADCSVHEVETNCRYHWVEKVLNGVVTYPANAKDTVTDRIDRLLTHRVLGTVIFFAMMIIVFQSIFSWAVPLQDLIEHVVDQFGTFVAGVTPEGMLQSLLVHGVISGVGAVLVFLPQIFMLFFFLAVLEDCGYMARAAYLMDNSMSRIGLSGKSFIPLMSSFACAVPGIMSARVIEDRRDRLITVLVAPLMSCSARLPVYALLIAAFIPNQRFLAGWVGLQGLTLFALYCLGIVAAITVAKVLKLTMLRGETPPFVMELPDYHLPSPRTVILRVLDRGWAFVHGAGTLIFAVAVIVWAAAYFPHNVELETTIRAAHAASIADLDHQIQSLDGQGDAEVSVEQRVGQRQQLVQQREELENTISNRISSAQMEQSFLGRAGKLLEPIVKPLGWDWRIGCAVVASFPAREVVIGVMGVIYDLGEGQDDESATLRDKLQGVHWPDSSRKVFTVPVALSIMVFFALCAQCGATLVVIRRETNSWRWPLFTFAYMTTLAYVGALLTYQISSWLIRV